MLEGGRKGVDVEDGGFCLNEGKVERVISGRECASFYVWWVWIGIPCRRRLIDDRIYIASQCRRSCFSFSSPYVLVSSEWVSNLTMAESGVHVDDAIYSDVWYGLFFFSWSWIRSWRHFDIVAQHRTEQHSALLRRRHERLHGRHTPLIMVVSVRGSDPVDYHLPHHPPKWRQRRPPSSIPNPLCGSILFLPRRFYFVLHHELLRRHISKYTIVIWMPPVLFNILDTVEYDASENALVTL